MKLKSPKHQYGFSLTELMVAVTIGLIVLAGVSSVMVSNKKTYTAQDSLARLQENARVAMLILSYDIRNIGYWGCNPDMGNVRSTLNATASSSPFSLGNPLEGADALDSTATTGNLKPTDTTLATLAVTPRIGTDVLMIRGLDPSESFQVLNVMAGPAATMAISDQNTVKDGEILVITDCDNTDIFQVTGRTQSGGFDNLIHSSAATYTPGNKTGDDGQLIKAYGDDAIVMRFKSNMYYIATGASGEPSLFRQALVVSASGSQPQAQELVEGIENLQILYGVDTDGDNMADDYRRAPLVGASTWNNVVSIRFGIIARALANLQTTDLKTASTASQLDTKVLDIDDDGNDDFTGLEGTSTTQTGSGSTALDAQYQRRMFRTTILLRNMPK